MNKQNNNRGIDRESKLVAPKGEAVVSGEWVKQVGGGGGGWRGTNFQLQNNWIMSMKCKVWGK